MARNRVNDRTGYYSYKDYYNGTEAVLFMYILEIVVQIFSKLKEIVRHRRSTDHVNKKRVGNG